jgi:pimeloyl-ACP methyl ester carboxylesterase
LHVRIVGAVTLLAALATSDAAWIQDADRTVTANGHRLHVRVIDPSAARPGGPTLLFESGLGDSGSIWDKVIAVLPRDLRILTYDRPGLGSSEDDHEPPTLQHICSLLHEALDKVDARPPYILVSHSFGAVRMRMFTAMYPAEVSGLVFVDPTDFTATRADNLRDVWIPLGLGTRERDEFERLTVDQMAGASGVVRREYDVARRASLSDFQEFRALPPMPDVPLVMLVAQQKRPSEMHASFDLDAWYQKTMAVRIASLTRLAATATKSEVVITSNPDHGLHRSDPTLVAWAIKRVTQATK